MATSNKNLQYNDPEQVYVKKGYVITWYHIPSGNSFNQLNISLNLNGRVLDQYIMDVVTKKLHPANGSNR